MTPLDRLRQAAELLPAGASVTVTREALLEALGEPPDATPAPPAGDLTVAEVAAQLRRSPSTVRGWCKGERFVGAFKLNGRDWRVPSAAVETFLEGQRHPTSQGVDLGAWRRHRRSQP